MAARQASLPGEKYPLIETLPSLAQGQKFIKWVEKEDSSSSIIVDLHCDPKGFILYWRDFNKQKCEYLEISYIRDVRTGNYANVPKDKRMRELFASDKSIPSIQATTISVFYGTDFCQHQCINFVSLSKDEAIAKEWSEFLFKSATSQRMLNLSPYEQLMKFRSILLYGKATIDDKSRDFCLPVLTLISCLVGFRQDYVERQYVVHMLQSVGLPYGKKDILTEKNFTEQKFYELFFMMISKNEIEDILHKHSSSKKKLQLNSKEFENFLNKEQRHPGLNELLYPFYTQEKTTRLIQDLETHKSYKKKNLLSPQGLFRYLMDFDNELIDPIKYALNEDMEKPISNYFINSSHNTYLSGHQLKGKSETEMYRQILISGCRCIELDCWPDEGLDEPIITHGNTFCTKILFKDVIVAINESAFKASPYPVILSFENYCGLKMQQKMVRYLVDILGDKLLKKPLKEYKLEPGAKLPSPKDLKYKILCKFRYKKTNIGNLQSTSQCDSENEKENEQNYETKSTDAVLNMPINLKEKDAMGMATLVNYVQPCTFKSFDESKIRNVSYEMSSFSETTAINILKENSKEFINYNKRQLSRIYPKGKRISSTNYLPQIFWNIGCQMVALNFQTLDFPMQLNNAKFEFNNKSGYLLKPEIMSRTDLNKDFDPFEKTPLDGIVATSLKVRILSGIYLGLNDLQKNIGQSVQLELYGLPVDSVTSSRSHKVKALHDKSFYVKYYDPRGFTFQKIIMPDLAVLVVSVYDEQNKLFGRRFLPVNNLRPGYRFISLKNESNQPLNMCFVFVYIELKDYVPDHMEEFANALVNPIDYVRNQNEKEEMLRNLISENETDNYF